MRHRIDELQKTCSRLNNNVKELNFDKSHNQSNQMKLNELVIDFLNFFLVD
jgi:hypothetical protein